MSVISVCNDQARAWEGFVRETNLNRQIVRPEIASSWMRCRNTQLNPFDKYYCEVLHNDELCSKLEGRQDLIRIVKPFLRMLMKTCDGEIIAFLSDEEGYILDLLGKDDVITMVKRLGVVKGANLSERVAGTNTIGTVLIDKKPLQVLAHEHYCRAFHGWTCFAAPIFDLAGQIIGVLNISGKHSEVYPNSLGIVISAAMAIQSQLKLEKVYDELNQVHNLSKTVMNSISEGLVTLNHKGEITQINHSACKLLGLEPAEHIGRSLHELCNSLPPLQKLLDNGRSSDQVIVSENSRGTFSFTISTQPIKSNNDQIIGAVATFAEVQSDRNVTKNSSGARYTFDNMIGVSESFLATVSLARKASASSSTVLLQGESGTGKEIFAQSIHSASKRARGPFIAVNCATIPRELIESELFGYEDGAFTGAKRGGHPGKFELASGGTIFLDEIGDMPVDLQVSLLRFLQEKQITRLGGRKTIPVDVRIIAATHRDLREEIAKGRFREDLFYRLYIINIKIPPLRERPGDVSLLADHFVRNICTDLCKNRFEISHEAMNRLMTYSWPGNVRELENALERAINMASDKQILLEHLPETLASSSKISAMPNLATGLLSLEELERIAIIKTIQSQKGNITQASQILGVSRHTLYNKIKQYCIEF